MGPPALPVPGRTQWGEGSRHTRSPPPVRLPEEGDLTEVWWWVPGSCGYHSCPGGASPCCGGSLSTGQGGACAVAREIAVSSYARISPEPGFHPNAALSGVQGGWGGAAPFRGPWTHQKGPCSVILSPVLGCRALLAFLGSSAFRGHPTVDTSPKGKTARPRNPRTTELLPAHGSSRPRYQGALCRSEVQASSLLSLSLSLPLREPLG